MTRSPRHPVADLKCGVKAKHRVLEHNGGMNCCGVHALYWKRRGYTVIPIITIKGTCP